jgi:hypothetical protein
LHLSKQLFPALGLLPVISSRHCGALRGAPAGKRRRHGT